MIKTSVAEENAALAKAQLEFATLIYGFQSFQLATVNAAGMPESSYAPFIRDTNGDFVIFASGLASHTANLEQLGKASIFFIENEEDAQNIYARKRLSFACSAEKVDRQEDEWGDLVDRFELKFGSIITIFKKSKNFRIIRLSPKAGQFVNGFGQAYQITGPQMSELVHITPER